MRNIHAQITSEYGQENVKTFRRWEKFELKMADFSTTGDSPLDASAKA